MGAYHTIDLELNRKFTLIKEEWDSIDLGRIEMATDPTQVLFYVIFLFLNKYKLSYFRQQMWQQL